MSVTEEVGIHNTDMPALSFKERLAQRRKELETNANFELPVPGYDDLWARYRVLGYEEIRDIGIRIEKETSDQSEGERLTAAETLAMACVELLEYKGLDDNEKPVFVSLECSWSAETAREYFGIEIPIDVSARHAMTSIFPYPRDMLMMTHFQEYLSQSMGYLPEIEEILQGES